MSAATPGENPPAWKPPVSTFAGPVAELIAQRMLQPPARPGTLAQLDHFEILRLLGGGGMGIVLLGHDLKTNRDVAIKLIRSELATNQQVAHRFLKEAGHLKRLRHENIVAVTEISDRAEGPYFVMPYFEKGSLASRIKPGQPLDTESILDIATQVADGLICAHRSGIIHRDLKPANVLLANSDLVSIADFGLARTVFNDTIVEADGRQMEGTAPYMSPAVAAGDAEDTRCDIYSFGALLYEMLTGHPPYKGQTTREILNQVIAAPPKPISNLNPDADRRLVAVAEKAMARELRDRYADMRDVLKDLQLIKAGRPPLMLRENHTFRNLLLTIRLLILVGIVGLIIRHFLSARPPVVSTPAPKPPIVTTPAPPPVVTPTPAPSPAPTFTTFAGQTGVAGAANGPAQQAQFRLPNSLAVDSAGNVYVADTANSTIRKITLNGSVSTFAGAAGVHGTGDGPGTDARFWAPFGVAADPSGNVYVADTINNTIRKISPAGIVSTLAGLAGHAGSRDGASDAARFRNPWGVAADAAGDVFVADQSNDTIRKITPAGIVTTLAGQAGISGSVDGPGATAQFNNPFAIAVDSAGNIYVADSANDTIRKITPARKVITLAGLAGHSGNTDASGSSARFSNPQGLATDTAGNLYVADSGNARIRKITPDGNVTTVSPNLPLANPCGLALDNNGNLYIADTENHCIRKLSLK